MYTKKQILRATKVLVQEGLIKYPTCVEEEVEVKSRIIQILEQTKVN